MDIRTVSIIRRDILFVRGRTIIPCELCGMRYADRLRIVVSDDGKQRVIHICIKSGCLERLVGSSFDFTEVGKVRSNGVGRVDCSICTLPAKGGIWLYKRSEMGLASPNELTSNHPQFLRFFPKYEAALCLSCLESRLISLKQDFVSRGGTWNAS